MHVRGLEIGDVVHRWIESGASKWHVTLLTGDAAVFCGRDQRCFALISRRRLLDPVAAVVEPWPAVRNALRLGAELRGSHGVLTGSGLVLDFSGLSPWPSAAPRCSRFMHGPKILDLICPVLLASQAGSLTKNVAGWIGPQPQPPFQGGAVAEGLIKFMESDPWHPENLYPPHWLIGLGDGLTPEGDDLVVGWLAARYAYSAAVGANRLDLRQPVQRWLRKQVTAETTVISAQLLLLAAAGRICQPAAQLIILLGSRANYDELHQAMMTLTQWGATSGRAVLAGITLILRHLVHRPR